DPERLGLGLQAFVRVQLNHHDAESVAACADFVNEWDEVVACHALTGDMDYLLQIAVSDLDHFSRFLLDRLLAQAGVSDVNSSFVLRTVKAFRGMPLPAAGVASGQVPSAATRPTRSEAAVRGAEGTTRPGAGTMRCRRTSARSQREEGSAAGASPAWTGGRTCATYGACCFRA